MFLRNYLNDNSWFGETSGTALISSVMYRMVFLVLEVFACGNYIMWVGSSDKQSQIQQLLLHDYSLNNSIPVPSYEVLLSHIPVASRWVSLVSQRRKNLVHQLGPSKTHEVIWVMEEDEQSIKQP